MGRRESTRIVLPLLPPHDERSSFIGMDENAISGLRLGGAMESLGDPKRLRRMLMKLVKSVQRTRHGEGTTEVSS